MVKKDIPKLNNQDEDKGIRKNIWIVFGILFVIFIILVFFFVSKYLITKKQISKMFGEIKEVEPDTEFEAGLFLSLTEACLGKEIGESCEYNFNDAIFSGTCVLSSKNNTVCIS